MTKKEKSGNDVVIVEARRSPIGKAGKAFSGLRPDELGAQVLRYVVNKVLPRSSSAIDDILVGCAIPEGEQGMNLARIITLRAGLPNSVPAATVNRFCASGLETIALATAKITAGYADVVVAGGVESMSRVPMPGVHPAATFSPNPYLAKYVPGAYAPMLITAENVRATYGISRERQDAFALQSHLNAASRTARTTGEIVPITFQSEGWGDEPEIVCITADEGPRPDTSAEKLAALEPAIAKLGLEYSDDGLTVTAGNSSQMSDGAAFVVLMSREHARRHDCVPLARLTSYAVAGVAPEIMGIGPIAAVPKALKQAGLALDDISYIELNEAFAVQSLAVMDELGMDSDRVNVNGGAIALGHPLGCSGTRLTVTLLHQMLRSQSQYGMVTMCVGGGQGAAGIFELE